MTWEIHHGEALSVLSEIPSESVQTCVTSPPYWRMRDYKHPDQLGQEETPDLFIERLVEILEEVRRVLRPDGVLWLNLGDSYAGKRSGLKPKDMVGIPWRVALSLRDAGWWLRRDIVWHKPNAMPESATDRPHSAHEYLFMLTKSARYYYDANSVMEPDCGKPAGNGFSGRQGGARDSTISGGSGSSARWVPTGLRHRRSVWSIPTRPFAGAHFSVFPPDLVEPCILAGSRPGDTVLDPFVGSGTTGIVALRLGRNFLGIELNRDFAALARGRIQAAMKEGE